MPGGYKTFFMKFLLLLKPKMLKIKDFSCMQTFKYGIYHANKY